MAGNMKEKSIVSALEVQTISAKNVKLKDTIKELKSVASQQLQLLSEGPHKLRGELREVKCTLKGVTKKNKVYDRNKKLKKDALRKSRCIQKDLTRVKYMSEKRLERLDISTNNISKLQSMLDENKSKLHHNQVKKIREGDQHGGAYTWPLWILQLVLEMLVNGAPPSSIPSSIVSHISITSPDIEIKEVPCVSYVRKCQSILRIIGDTLASYQLAKAK